MKNNPFWAAARKIFIPENNLGLEASHLHTMMNEYDDVTTYFEKSGGKPGICKTHQKTIDYQFLINSMLYEGTIKLDAELFTVSKDFNVESITALLRGQMERFHWEKKDANDAFGRDRWAITGKQGDKQDDLFITLEMAAFFGRGIINNPRRLL